jgi:hypothetical protein
LLQIAIGGKSLQFPSTRRAANGPRSALKTRGLRVFAPAHINCSARLVVSGARLSVIFNYKLDSILTTQMTAPNEKCPADGPGISYL